MTYESFKTAILKKLNGYFPSDTSITIHTIPRNNSITADGLTIMEPGINIAPTIYLKDYYDDFCHGLSIENILEKLLASYYQYRPAESIDPSFFSSFSNIKGRIVFKLIHQKKNKELLMEIPHVPYLDLAIVFYCLVSMGKNGNATILIRNSHLDLWNTDTGQLMKLAQVNTPFLLSSHCNELSDLLAPFLTQTGQAALCGCMSDDQPMYVLTNESRLYGAACILYDDLLADIAKQLDSDLYILPSSIHEVILIPAGASCQTGYLNSMVQEVNETQVTSEEILSDHVYYYNRREKKVLM